MFKLIILIVFVLAYKINAQYNRRCSSNPLCSCHSSAINCAEKDLTEIPNAVVETKIFYLNGNRISIIKTGAFKNLLNLRSLYLSDNRIKTLENRAFEGLQNLEELQLFKNEINYIHPGAFTGLIRLRFLYLNLNKILSIEPRTFIDLISLQKLYLNQNKLTTFKEGVFSESSPLDTLRLQQNDLVCDCDLLWLWEFFENQKKKLKLNYNPLIGNCSQPERLHNRRLISLSKSDFDCKAPIILTQPKDYELYNLVRIDCVTTGNPKPSVTWMKGNQQLRSNGRIEVQDDGTLIINNANNEDIGEYECIAKNKIGDARLFIRVKENMNPENVEKGDEFIFEDYPQEDFDVPSYLPKNDLSISALKFIQLPEDQMVNEGSNVEFKCRVANNYYHKINWMKDGEPIESTNRFVLHSNGDLNIYPVRATDEGFYVCVISDGRDEKYAQAQLIVNVPPTFLEKPTDLDLVEGSTAEFNCFVSGKPRPIVKWTKNGKQLSIINITETLKYEFSMGSQVLKIYNLDRLNDQGTYTCKAQNIAFMSSAEAKLTIRPGIKPYFNSRAQPDRTVYEYQEDLTLLCKPEGIPKPQVLWYKDGFRIVTDSRVYFDPFGTLKINEVKADDGGEYTCKAKNSAGEAIHKFSLTVIDLHSKIITNDVIDAAIKKAKGDVNKQYVDTRRHMHDRRKPKTSSDLLALLRFPKERTLVLTIGEEVYERALELVYKHALNVTYNLTNKEFTIDELLTHQKLQRIADLSGCHRHKRKVNCSQRCLNYRTSDGTCNNLQKPHMGAANTPLRRLLPAEYENNFSTPKGWTQSLLHNGYRLPSARTVSSKIISTKKITEDSKFSLMLMQWGQFFDHDLDHTVMAGSLNRFSNGLACKDSCSNEQPCFPIEIDKNDSHRNYHPDMCMEFIRSSAICGTGETSLITNQVLQREQINQLTSYIDGSNVYGSNDQDAFDIRERITNNGQLKVHVTTKHQKGLLPFNLDTPIDCQRDNTSLIGCFLAGDYRANEQLALLAIHNVWVRQHNRIAEKLHKVNPNWSSEQIYQETRKIIGAQMQHITYAHWLPYIFGPIGMKMLGEYKGYNPNVDPTVSNEFATAAFRFGHALIQPFSFRLNETYQPVPEGHLLLRDSFFAPQRYYHEGGPDPLMRGIFGMPAKLKMPREIMNDELTEKLFHITRSISQDLASLNIQRSRDHGLPGYAAYRKYCKMSEVKSFDDLKNEISSSEVRKILKELYGDVRNIDLWPGGILEDVLPDSKLGPLFMCIISEQLKALRDGDRFWYENSGVFTPDQLAEIKKTTLAKVLCETGDDIQYIQKDVFLNAKYPNDMVKCSQIEDMSLEPWKNCCSDNAKGLCSEPSVYTINVETSRYKRDINQVNTGKKNCIVDNKTYFDDERWLKNKCTECICLDGEIKCVKLSLQKC